MSEDIKIMPHSIEAEQGLIGAILCQGAEAIEKMVPAVMVSSFWDSKHRLIFYVALELWKASKPIETLAIISELTKMDKLTQAGGDYYIFSLSKNFPTDDHIREYIKEICSTWRLRKLIELGSDILKDSWNVTDANEHIEAIERRFYSLSEDRQDDNLLAKAHIEVMETLRKIKAGEGIGAIPTGISAIDNSIMGIVPGMMDVYAAEAGCGKTSLVEMIALTMLLRDEPVLIFQRDMTPAGFYFRLACRMAGVTVSVIRKYGQTIPIEVEKVEKYANQLSKTHLKLYSPDGCTGSDVRSIARREVRKSGVKLVIVDHMRTLRHSKQNSWDGLEENSGYIRQSTNETGVAHIVLTHINREGAKSDRPTISNIKGGDQLKDDSDNCCVMWAPEGRPERSLGGSQVWPVNFAFDKSRWDWSAIETMNYNGPKMRFEMIKP